MTGTPTPLPATPSDEDDLLAAEFVIGVQDMETRARLEDRQKRDPGFAGSVSDWEYRLDGLNDEFASAPAPDLLAGIEARLFPVATKPRRGWFGIAGASVLAASLLLAVFFTYPPAPPQAPVLATLAAADLAYEVRSDGETLQVIRIAGAPAAAGQVHELWVIAPDAAPVSLGLLAGGPLEIAYPTPPAGWLLAVSVEPTGGSPTGAPTGPVILTAEIGA